MNPHPLFRALGFHRTTGPGSEACQPRGRYKIDDSKNEKWVSSGDRCLLEGTVDHLLPTCILANPSSESDTSGQILAGRCSCGWCEHDCSDAKQVKSACRAQRWTAGSLPPSMRLPYRTWRTATSGSIVYITYGSDHSAKLSLAYQDSPPLVNAGNRPGLLHRRH